jgi:hypothetical protein
MSTVLTRMKRTPDFEISDGRIGVLMTG